MGPDQRFLPGQQLRCIEKCEVKDEGLKAETLEAAERGDSAEAINKESQNQAVAETGRHWPHSPERLLSRGL